MSVKNLQIQMLALTKPEQEHLLLFLTNTLNENKDTLITKEQLAEINKRLIEFENGRVKAIDASEVMTTLYAKYKS